MEKGDHAITEIIRAIYGPADVTEKVRELYNAGCREFHAENEVFGDP